jgi:glucose-1-phosphate cytidylyltransferase
LIPNIKVVILAGGRGLRISEESDLIPKPLIKIGSDPMLVHLMRYFSKFDLDNFIIALGYKGHLIKEYFNNYALNSSDLYLDFNSGERLLSENRKENWKLDLIDTGETTMTGGRIKRLSSKLNQTFIVTYGDGLSNVNLNDLLNFHKSHKKLASVTSVSPPGRYGVLDIDEKNVVKGFVEKPINSNQYINGGFMVFEKEVLELVKSDSDTLEEGVLSKLSQENELMAFKHSGFWQSMDTLRDKRVLEELISNGNAPWL